jgi:hypothetical protein
VDSSANMLMINSLLVMLSRRFSLFRPLCGLYSLAVLSAQVL